MAYETKLFVIIQPVIGFGGDIAGQFRNISSAWVCPWIVFSNRSQQKYERQFLGILWSQEAVSERSLEVKFIPFNEHN